MDTTTRRQYEWHCGYHGKVGVSYSEGRRNAGARAHHRASIRHDDAQACEPVADYIDEVRDSDSRIVAWIDSTGSTFWQRSDCT